MKFITTDTPVTVTYKNQDKVTGTLKVVNGSQQFETERFGRLNDFFLADIQSIGTNARNTIANEIRNDDEIYMQKKQI